MKVIPDNVDHINTRAWRGDVHVKYVTLSTCWKQGRRAAEAEFPFIHEILKRLESDHSVTILAPFGSLLVSAPLDSDDSEEDEDLEELVANPLPDVSSGLRELEDIASSYALECSSTPAKVDRTINMGNGQSINKSRALAASWAHRSAPLSAD